MTVAVLLLIGSIVAWNSFSDSDLPSAVEDVPAADTEIADTSETRPELPLAEKTPEPTRSRITPSPTPPRILAKIIASSGETGQKSDPRATWTPTPVPTDTPTPTPTYMPTYISPQEGRPVSRPFGVGRNEHWIDVDLSAQSLMAYEGDVLVFTTNVSSGTWQHPTVTGQFRIWVRYASQTMDGRRLGYDYYLENVPYVMYFYQDYALHGTYWHNNFGTPMSHGCVNLETSDAEWIFNWSSIGTLVNVHQ